MFAFSRFKYLERLLLVHGHWNYDRLARMVLYFFYKNAALVLVTFWFQLYNGFSSSIMFDAMYLMMFNMFWTSLPPLAIGKSRLCNLFNITKVHSFLNQWLQDLCMTQKSVTLTKSFNVTAESLLKVSHILCQTKAVQTMF